MYTFLEKCVHTLCWERTTCAVTLERFGWNGAVASFPNFSICITGPSQPSSAWHDVWEHRWVWGCLRTVEEDIVVNCLNNGSNIIKPWAKAHGFIIFEPLFKIIYSFCFCFLCCFHPIQRWSHWRVQLVAAMIGRNYLRCLNSAKRASQTSWTGLEPLIFLGNSHVLGILCCCFLRHQKVWRPTIQKMWRKASVMSWWLLCALRCGRFKVTDSHTPTKSNDHIHIIIMYCICHV